MAEESGAIVAAAAVSVVAVFAFLAWYYRFAVKELCQKIKDFPERGISGLTKDGDDPVTL